MAMWSPLRPGRGLEALDERELGRRLEAAYWRLGYRVRRPPSDPGVHLLVSGGGQTAAVEPRRTVDEKAVRAAAAFAAREGCGRTLVVTPGRLGGEVRRAAEAAGVELLGPRALRRLLAAGSE
jgi:HJR/Mrr/RecB family endonuclease